MKKLIKIALALAVGFVLYSCEDFLERVPKDELTTLTSFSSSSGIKSYVWQFYTVFPAYDETYVKSEFNTDLIQEKSKTSYSSWIWQKVEIPTNSDDYTTPFKNIRACNLLLDNLDESKISESEKNHWRSVTYFFKAYNYMDLINKYGDITWVEHNLSDGDEETLYGPRTSRDIVAAKILELLEYAEANINPDGNVDVDGKNTINVHVVRALISRFGLREGTWRKYHGLSDANTYLNACVSASEKLLVSFPDIMDDYAAVYTSESLAGQAGIILYKNYERGQVTHFLSHRVGSSSGYTDLTRKAVDMYLMTDGQTRWTSPLFQGEYGHKEFKNRDIRLYCSTPMPYKVIAPGTATTFTYTGNAEDREYLDYFNSLALSGGMKILPVRCWCSWVVDDVPNFMDNNGGKTWSTTLTGYQFWKFGTDLNLDVWGQDMTDAPIFRIGEVMLNYAEATKELGDFDQSICDMTINKLRARGKVAHLNLSNIPADPTRDPEIDPDLWEIRRERAIELMGDGFRFDDLRRWKKMNYATKQKLGKYIVAADENNKVPILNNANEGYVSYFGVPPSFPDYYYLYPIPSNQIILTNGVVSQNPGWEQ